MNVLGKVFVVTGAAGGIGREVVLELLHKGAKVVGIDIDKKGLNETCNEATEICSRFSLLKVDITNEETVMNLPKEIMAKYGQIDGVINIAGIIQKMVDVDSISLDFVHKVMDVNFYGTLHMVKAFLPILKERDEAMIVNVCSMGGFLPVPLQTIYGASKAAVKILTEGLQTELRTTHVHVMNVMPGGVSTNIMDKIGVDSNQLKQSKLAQNYKMLTPEQAAKRIVKNIGRNRKRLVLGTDAKFMDMLYRFSPRLASYTISKMLNFEDYV